MINLTPMEEFYLSEILKDKEIQQIAKENGIKKNSISICLNRLKKRTNLDKMSLLKIVAQKKYKVTYRSQPHKNKEQIFSEKDAINLRKAGFTDREIVRMFNKRVDND